MIIRKKRRQRVPDSGLWMAIGCVALLGVLLIAAVIIVYWTS